MLVFQLALASNGWYVPLSATNTTYYSIVDNIRDVVNRTILFLVQDPPNLPSEFENLANIFGNDGFQFKIASSELAKNISQGEGISIPGLAIAESQQVDVSTSLSGEKLLFLLESIRDPPACETLSDLYRVLGSTLVQIVTTESRLYEAFLCQTILSADYEGVSVVIAAVGLVPEGLAIFRAADQGFEGIPPGENTSSVTTLATSRFRNVVSDDLTGDLELIAFLGVLDEEAKDFLYDLAPYVTNETHRIIVVVPSAFRFLLDRFDLGDREVFVCNYRSGYYFADAGELRRGPNWVERAKSFFAKVDAGDAVPRYLSEPDPGETGPVQTLVGTTYSAFVNESGVDAVVLFKRADCQHCGTFLPVFSELAETAGNLTWLRFGVVDIELNAVPGGFPWMPGVPHVVFFPGDGRPRDWLRGGRDRANLVRFLRVMASQSLDAVFEDPGPPDLEHLPFEILQELLRSKDMPDFEKERLVAWTDEMNVLLNATKAAKKDEL